MPRLLVITTVPVTLRGFLLPYARHFRNLGWRVDAMSAGAPECDVCRREFDAVWDVGWSRNPLDARNLTGPPAAIRAIAEREGYDIVHVHTPVAAFVSRYALRALPPSTRPVVVYTAHGFHFHDKGSPLTNAAFLGLERIAGRWTDHLIVMNKADLDAVQRYRIVSPNQVSFMWGIGVDPSVYSPDTVTFEAVARVRSELQLQPGDRLILQVGEMINRKRHADTLLAFSRLLASNIVLAFAGRGPLEEDLRAEVRRLGIVDRVRFLGERRDVPALVGSSEMLVSPSAHEGLPRCVIEAMCMERPIVGSDVRGTRDLLKDSRGWLFAPGDVDEFGRAMDAVLSDSMEARTRSSRARDWVLDNCAIDKIVRQHADLYSSLLQARNGVDGVVRGRTACT